MKHTKIETLDKMTVRFDELNEKDFFYYKDNLYIKLEELIIDIPCDADLDDYESEYADVYNAYSILDTNQTYYYLEPDTLIKPIQKIIIEK